MIINGQSIKSVLYLFAFSFSLIFYCQGISQSSYPFQNPNLPINERIDDLMNRLTLEEKASMTLYNSPAIERLGIPEYNWWNEALHGVARAGKATVFPQAIGMAATFDEDLIERVSSAIADEARAKHNAAKAKGSYQQYTGLSFWTPNVNIYRDPRWGRGQETWGEDPYLTSMMGVAFVKGLQGDDPNHLKAAACAKHFAVHNGPEKTRHEFNAIPSEIDFHETYLPAFEALVKNGVAGVMCAYNQVYGSPCCGNTPLLKTILREQWGFDGYIVSDCWALSDFISFQKIVPDATDAAAMAVKAGVNLNCGTVYKSIPEAIKEGKITESELDAVLWPLLKTRIKLGLLDVGENLLYADIGPEVPGSEEHRQLAYEAAVKSVVLLKNKNQCLPLDLNEIHKIYVTGPTAADNAVLLGNYNGLSGQLVTLLEGIIQKVDAGTVVDYSMGALLNTDSVYHGIYHAGNSDVIIASIGNSRLLEGEEGDAMLSKSGGDRADIKLPENQVEFIRKLRQAGPDKKLIVVINGGGAIAFPEINDLADAVLFAWYPGEQGGKAIADLIFGDQNPSGRLPVTFYADTEDLPPFEDYSMKYRTYRYFSGEPLYAFGHGLSYTSFEYSDLKTNAEVFSTAEQIEVSLRISNSGNYEGEEVVQLYVKDTDPGPDRPIKSLKGIKRVFLKPGESQKVTFIIPLKDLRHWNTDIDEWKLNRGVYGIEVGASSVDIRQTISVKVIR